MNAAAKAEIEKRIKETTDDIVRRVTATSIEFVKQEIKATDQLQASQARLIGILNEKVENLEQDVEHLETLVVELRDKLAQARKSGFN